LAELTPKKGPKNDKNGRNQPPHQEKTAQSGLKKLFLESFGLFFNIKTSV
jgi:hypothetical protein